MNVTEFTGKVVSGQATIYAAVSGHYVIERRGQLLEWYGELTIESGEPPSMFNGRLITDDGKQGDLFAKSMNFGEPTIPFQGTGAIE